MTFERILVYNGSTFTIQFSKLRSCAAFFNTNTKLLYEQNIFENYLQTLNLLRVANAMKGKCDIENNKIIEPNRLKSYVPALIKM